MLLKTRALGAMLGLVAFFTLAGAAGAADRPYTEGAVLDVSSIRTQDGRFDDYMASEAVSRLRDQHYHGHHLLEI